MIMNTKIHFALTAVAALSFAACDSKQENRQEAALEQKADALENKADAVENNAEKRADAVESNSSRTSAANKDAADASASSVRKQGDNTPMLSRTRQTPSARRKTKFSAVRPGVVYATPGVSSIFTLASESSGF